MDKELGVIFTTSQKLAIYKSALERSEGLWEDSDRELLRRLISHSDIGWEKVETKGVDENANAWWSIRRVRRGSLRGGSTKDDG